MEEDNSPEEDFNLDSENLLSGPFHQILYLSWFADVYHEFKETFRGIRRILEETSELIDSILKDIKAGGNLLEENNLLKGKTAILEENKLKIEKFHENAKRLFDRAVREPYQIPPSIAERSNRRIWKMENAIHEIKTLQELKSGLSYIEAKMKTKTSRA